MLFLCQGKDSLQAFQSKRSMEEGKEKNSEEGTSEEDEAMNRRGVEGAGIREVGEDR